MPYSSTRWIICAGQVSKLTLFTSISQNKCRDNREIYSFCDITFIITLIFCWFLALIFHNQFLFDKNSCFASEYQILRLNFVCSILVHFTFLSVLLVYKR
ncbi:hypothetical protein BVU_2687 [Phocaeicola vulgatus ATCC 8482]|uniref:Uncharacterized protein n=1 Tax=Phocaeicola vulgatus (strain ATCC 8482 / DSM 1447 / JCM 5826 / CCUG 4940 / NBRC 14291 / NCTC 11154) TaxID=435590 RepID=A6L3S5_PHOV8|nr:hypothetical protein BVU_2687 [Phocaeicola vulgatus ATCC 8482]